MEEEEMQDLAVHIVQNSGELSGKYPYLSDVLGKTLRQAAGLISS